MVGGKFGSAALPFQGKPGKIRIIQGIIITEHDHLAGNLLPVRQLHPGQHRIAKKFLGRPGQKNNAILGQQFGMIFRQEAGRQDKRDIRGEHLPHGKGEAHGVQGITENDEFLAGGAVAVADHASIIGDTEKAQEVLEGGEGFPGT